MKTPLTPPKSRREEYTEATRQALLAAGRMTFASQGYQAAGMEAISTLARVTRGAFYHHFVDKTALFDAVTVLMQAEAASAIQASAMKHEDVWARLYAGIDAYLDVCLDSAYARIVIQEAPAVLGYARFREIEEQYPMALLTATLKSLKKRGELEFDDIDLLSRMVDAMICKVALLLADTPNQKMLRQRSRKIISATLDGFRTTSAPSK